MLPFTKRLLLGVGLWLALSAPARAAINWAYFTENTSAVNGTQFIPADNAASSGGHITMTQPMSGLAGVHDSTGITLANLTTNELNAGTTATFTNLQGQYDIKLSIVYKGVTMFHDFHGVITGSYDNGQQNLGHHFVDEATPIPNTLATPPSWLYTFADASFLVSLYDPIGSLPPPPGAGQGTINAYVTAFGGGTTTGITGVPEPSTMLLSCLGLSMVGFATWRKRRQNPALALA